MPVPTSMGVSLTAPQLASLKTAFDTIINTMNGLIAVNLTKPERQAIQSVAEERLPFVQTTFDSLLDSYPSLLPPFGNVTEARADYAYLMQLRGLSLLLEQAQEIVSDHELAAGSRSYEYMRDFYHMGKRAIERNVPGADTVVDALSPLFDRINEAPVLPGGVG
jgi:hypothetical protein